MTCHIHTSTIIKANLFLSILLSASLFFSCNSSGASAPDAEEEYNDDAVTAYFLKGESDDLLMISLGKYELSAKGVFELSKADADIAGLLGAKTLPEDATLKLADKGIFSNRSLISVEAKGLGDNDIKISISSELLQDANGVTPSSDISAELKEVGQADAKGKLIMLTPRKIQTIEGLYFKTAGLLLGNMTLSDEGKGIITQNADLSLIDGFVEDGPEGLRHVKAISIPNLSWPFFRLSLLGENPNNDNLSFSLRFKKEWFRTSSGEKPSGDFVIEFNVAAEDFSGALPDENGLEEAFERIRNGLDLTQLKTYQDNFECMYNQTEYSSTTGTLNDDYFWYEKRSQGKLNRGYSIENATYYKDEYFKVEQDGIWKGDINNDENMFDNKTINEWSELSDKKIQEENNSGLSHFTWYSNFISKHLSELKKDETKNRYEVWLVDGDPSNYYPTQEEAKKDSDYSEDKVGKFVFAFNDNGDLKTEMLFVFTPLGDTALMMPKSVKTFSYGTAEINFPEGLD